VSAVVEVIANVITQKSLQMGFIQSDDVVEHIAPTASHPPLGNAVLPTAVDRGLHALHVQGSNGSGNFQPVLLVAARDKESGSGLIREGLS
jgi:hypothetical protein